MANGLFGKLPARRDFISVNVPRSFVAPWENWLQAGLMASQSELGVAWGAAYHAAPAWRFWLDPNTCGEVAVGAFIPSLDGVGREYPLTLVATGDLAPPEYDRREAWFAQGEALLRRATGQGEELAATVAALEGLDAVPPGWPDANGDDVAAVPGGFVSLLPAEPASGDFMRLRVSARTDLLAGYTYWWTEGCANHPAWAMLVEGMPAPDLFTAMLTGRWARSPAEG